MCVTGDCKQNGEPCFTQKCCLPYYYSYSGTIGRKITSNLFCNMSDKVIWYIKHPVPFVCMGIVTRAKRYWKCFRRKREKNLALWSALIILSVTDKGYKKNKCVLKFSAWWKVGITMKTLIFSIWYSSGNKQSTFEKHEMYHCTEALLILLHLF